MRDAVDRLDLYHRADTSAVISLRALRKCARELQGLSTRTLIVRCHPSIEPAVRALGNFGDARIFKDPRPDEIGRTEVFQFVRDERAPDRSWEIERSLT